MRAVLLVPFVLLMMPSLAGEAPPAAPAKPEEVHPPRCTLTFHSTFDLAMDDTGRVTVPVTVNGTAKQLMVDTGASYSLLTFATVEELKLKVGVGDRLMVGVGGTPSVFIAHVDELMLGRVRASNFNLFIELDRMRSAGLLGADFLSQFDVDLDFAKAQMNLITAEHCNGDSVYWTHQAFGVIPFEIDNNHIMVKVQLDGTEITAALDTGAADTIMSLDKASNAFNLDEDKLKKSRHYPFKTLTLGAVTVNNPAIALLTDRESVVMGHHSSDLHMIIGMGVLRRLHLYVSYKDKMIYVTPATLY
jgi:predicted aspartyl protease